MLVADIRPIFKGLSALGRANQIIPSRRQSFSQVDVLMIIRGVHHLQNMLNLDFSNSGYVSCLVKKSKNQPKIS
ncbi:hypothetical protein [uncultured Nostoc sp.]|uniref:hypothetical protein n=1 Tax=uncultured Nostoc sp. TaxID=340711 RepID=UPI0035CC9A58